jgi:putative addiction module component (TIGR02574 family)
MPPTIQELGLDRLSIDDRLAVADAIWGSVAREAEAAPLPTAQRAELERRLVDSIARPDAVTAWEVVKSAGAGEGAAVSVPVVLRDEAQAEFDEAFDSKRSEPALA